MYISSVLSDDSASASRTSGVSINMQLRELLDILVVASIVVYII
jgi:hypothetical protein